MESMRWNGDSLELLDQTKLPKALEYIHCQDYRRVGLAIKCLEVRGAPAIGAAAAYGVVLGAQEVVKDAVIYLESLVTHKAEAALVQLEACNRRIELANESYESLNILGIAVECLEVVVGVCKVPLTVVVQVNISQEGYD